MRSEDPPGIVVFLALPVDSISSSRPTYYLDLKTTSSRNSSEKSYMDSPGDGGGCRVPSESEM